jgi:hypothetical protein
VFAPQPPAFFAPSAPAPKPSSDGAGGPGGEEAVLECVVCRRAPKNACCLPCGHVCMCRRCASTVQSATNACPLCATPIEIVIEILD